MKELNITELKNPDISGGSLLAALTCTALSAGAAIFLNWELNKTLTNNTKPSHPLNSSNNTLVKQTTFPLDSNITTLVIDNGNSTLI